MDRTLKCPNTRESELAKVAYVVSRTKGKLLGRNLQVFVELHNGCKVELDKVNKWVPQGSQATP